MHALISTTARATDARHLELSQPLQSVPTVDVQVLIFIDAPASLPSGDRTTDFLAWADRPRPSVGLREAGRDAIYED